MAGSYRAIDYRLRPAKHVERLMLCELLGRLKFGTVEKYQYIGLGSVYFRDFILFHKVLGIQRMISIESEVEDKPRFDDNLPFASIIMHYGSSHAELPKIDLAHRTIAWFDYDGKLTDKILGDVRYFVANAAGGSVLLLTINCQPGTPSVKDSTRLTKRLSKKVGEERVPPEVDDDLLANWGFARVCRRIVNNEILEVLNDRNGGRVPGQIFKYEQIINFHYSDGAKMLTIGGVLFDEGQTQFFLGCEFEQLRFFRSGEESFEIKIPKLTLREVMILERQMPRQEGIDLNYGSIPEEEAARFETIYRYFPSFSAVEL